MAKLLTAQPADYKGRTVDLLLFDDAAAVGDVEVSQALISPGRNGAEITGIVKAVQRFMLELCTIVGTMPYAPKRGCRFMADARSGYWRTPDDVNASFNASMIAVKDNLIADQTASDPPDECFADATLTLVSINLDSVSITIAYTSQAGTSRNIVYPLRTTYT